MIRHLSIRFFAIGAIVVMLLSTVALGCASYWNSQQVAKAKDRLDQTTDHLVEMEEARSLLSLESLAGFAYLVMREPDHLDAFRDVSASVDESLVHLRREKAAENDLQGAEIAGALAERHADLVRAFEDQVVNADVEPATPPADVLGHGLQVGVTALFDDLSRLRENERADFDAARAALEDAREWSVRTVWALAAFGAAIMLAGSIAALSWVIAPLERVSRAARAIASGDMTARAPVGGMAEVAHLGADVNAMAESLIRHSEELNAYISKNLEERTVELEAVNERLRFTQYSVDHSADPVVWADMQGRVVAVNEAACSQLGYTSDELLAMTVHDFVADFPAEEREGRFALLRQIGSITTEATHRTRDGRLYPAEVTVNLVEFGGNEYVCAFIRDITERKRAEEALRLTQFSVDSAADAILWVDSDARFTYVNEAACRSLGYTRDELLSLTVHDIDPLYPRDAWAEAWAELTRKGSLHLESRHRRKDGTVFPVEVRANLLRFGDEELNCVFVRDITDRKMAQRALEARARQLERVNKRLVRARDELTRTAKQLAEKSDQLQYLLEAEREHGRRDPLTGLLNHRAISEEIRNAAIAVEGRFAVAMADVEGMKAINDTYGHQAGDSVLVAASWALSRHGVVAGRYGGDEFIVLLPGADRQQAEAYRNAVATELAKFGLTDPASGASIPISLTIGLAVYPDEASTVDDLIRLSDSAMYAARRLRPIGPGGKRLPRGLGDERAAKMVGELVPLLTAPGDLDEKLRLVAHRLSVGAGYDAVNVFLFSPASGASATTNVFARAPEELVDAWRQLERLHSMEHPLNRALVASGRPIILDDPQNDPRVVPEQRKILKAAGLRSALIAPMTWEGELIGTLSVASKSEAAFSTRDARFIMAVATQVTAIVRMAALVEELQRTSEGLAQAHSDTVMMLAAAAEARDHVTGQHLHNIRALTEALARELGYGDEDVRAIGLASVLHDIGKIRVPDGVLSDNGPLGADSWSVMKQHTVWGGELLEGKPGFELATSVARCHHERWDGGGYPAGLKGEEIPEAATIVSVADAFDAMTSHRPYRSRVSIDEAVAEIAAHAGTQFSPKVVQALVRLHKRGALPAVRHNGHAHEDARSTEAA